MGLLSPTGRAPSISRELEQRLWTRRQDAHGQDDDLIFTSATGKRISTSNLMSRTLKPAAVEAGLGEWSIRSAVSARRR